MSTIVEHLPQRQLAPEFVKAYDRLPAVREIPTRRALRGMHNSGPRAIGRTITMQLLIAHLARAKSSTPEIGIAYYGHEAYTLDIGEASGVDVNTDWAHDSEQASIYLHTHPDPVEASFMWGPSICDLETAQEDPAVQLIASQIGLTVIPRLAQHLSPGKMWSDYYNENHKPELFGFNWNSGFTWYDNFIREVICPAHVSWQAIDPRLTIAEVAEQLQ